MLSSAAHAAPASGEVISFPRAGTIEHWAFEAGTPSGMIRNGYKASVIKQGDEVTITGFHAKDPAQNMGMLRELTTADGTVFGLFGPQQAPSAQ